MKPLGFIIGCIILGGSLGMLVGVRAAQTIGVLLAMALIVLIALFPRRLP